MELDEQELALAKKVGLMHVNGQLISWSGAGNAIRELYWRAQYDPDTAEIAKNILKSAGWHIIEQDIANDEGWCLLGDEILRFDAVFKSNEEAVEHVKKEAARGDVLAEKAIIEIARRKLNGSSKNVVQSQKRYPNQY